jgi:thiosulfate reductase cytochrome b subunit
MTASTQRTIVRWIHLILAIPILGYVYSPFEELPNYAGPTRFVFFPAIVLTGLWMWKGHVVRRWMKSPQTRSEPNG